MTTFLQTIRLMVVKAFGTDKNVAKRELFDAENDDYLNYLREVRQERENAISAALLERSRE